MNIERYVKGTFIDSSGVTITLIDGSKHLLTNDSITGMSLKIYIEGKLQSDVWMTYSIGKVWMNVKGVD